MSQRIIVDPERLGALAASLQLAHTTLAASPSFSHLEAGDVRRRLPDEVTSFITSNQKVHDELVQQLDMAAQATDAAARCFAGTESSLVRALTGEGSR